jgi:pimeloyl-ACP methyl ester carboxylesterase
MCSAPAIASICVAESPFPPLTGIESAVLKREVRTVDLGRDRSLRAVSAGEGRDVVLIHGALNTSADWLGSFRWAAPFGSGGSDHRPADAEALPEADVLAAGGA